MFKFSTFLCFCGKEIWYFQARESSAFVEKKHLGIVLLFAFPSNCLANYFPPIFKYWKENDPLKACVFLPDVRQLSGRELFFQKIVANLP